MVRNNQNCQEIPSAKKNCYSTRFWFMWHAFYSKQQLRRKNIFGKKAEIHLALLSQFSPLTNMKGCRLMPLESPWTWLPSNMFHTNPLPYRVLFIYTYYVKKSNHHNFFNFSSFCYFWHKNRVRCASIHIYKKIGETKDYSWEKCQSKYCKYSAVIPNLSHYYTE